MTQAPSAVPDAVRGTIPFVTRVGSTITSEYIPLTAQVDDPYICLADGKIYKVAVVGTAVPGGYPIPATLTYVGNQTTRFTAPWDGNTLPSNAAAVGSDQNFPDASYFAIGLVNGKAVYTYTNQYTQVEYFRVYDYLKPQIYETISDGGKTFTLKVAGDAPDERAGAGAVTIDDLFAKQAEVNVTPKATDVFDTARKTALLKFYNILDAAGNLTALGVPLANRIITDTTADPAGNLYSDTPSYNPTTGAWTGASTAWTTDPKSQMVDFATAAQANVGFLPGRDGWVVAKPTALTATAGAGQASVAFTGPAAGTYPITNYAYSIDDGATWVVRSPAATTSPIVITGLTNGTEYSIKLAAINLHGQGAPSDAATVTPITTAGAPTGLVATAGAGQASVAFVVPVSNGGAAISNYSYSTDDGATWTPRAPAATTSPVVIAGLTNGTEYSVKLRATNAAGAGTASAAVLVTPVTTANAPTDLVATPGTTDMSVAFTAPTDDGGADITNYKYSINGGTDWTAFDPVDVATPVVIAGLTAETTYSVKLRAVNSVGDGTASGAISVTTGA